MYCVLWNLKNPLMSVVWGLKNPLMSVIWDLKKGFRPVVCRGRVAPGKKPDKNPKAHPP